MLRRFFYMSVMVLGEDSHGIQATLINFQSLIFMMYLVHAKPFESKSFNLLNIHNEAYLGILTVFFIIWTDAFDMKHDEKYTMGFLPIALCLLFLFVNIIYALYSSLVPALRRCIRRCKLRANRQLIY